jgi:hypothetical protein
MLNFNFHTLAEHCDMDHNADKKNGDWLEDVRRWCSSHLPAYSKSDTCVAGTETDPTEPTDFSAIGYEAAHPALQARHWPEPLSSDFIDLK